jgi:hypothetical protein
VVVTNSFGSATSGLVALTVSNLPLMLTCSQANASWGANPFVLTVAGPAGSNVVVCASTNLKTWVPLATNPLSLGSLILSDDQVRNYPQRFYRAELSP